jgi:hypothetical protein
MESRLHKNTGIAIHTLAAIAADGDLSQSRIDTLLANIDKMASDHTTLIDQLHLHGLTGPAYLILEQIATTQSHAAQELTANLRPLFLVNHTRTLANIRTLENTRTIFDPLGIQVVATQGAALLARGVYETCEERPMADADALIAINDRVRALEALSEARFELSDDGERWLDGAGILDLHTSPLGMERIAARRLALPLTADLVWQYSSRAPDNPIFAPGLLVPTLPMLWAMGLAHIQKHSFTALTWFVDMARLAGKMVEEDMKEAHDLMVNLRLQGAASVVGQVINSCWNMSLPERLQVDRESLEGGMSALVNSVVEDVKVLQNTHLVGERMLWRMAPSWRSRMSLVWESAFPRGKVMKEIYPRYRGALRPIYMIRRIWDLIRLWK